MEVSAASAAAEENEHLKAAVAAAKADLAVAKKVRDTLDENARLAEELAALQAERAEVLPAAAVGILCGGGFTPAEATGLLPLLDASPATVLALDALGRLAAHLQQPLSATFLCLQAAVRS